MINKIGVSPINFKGSIIKNDMLKRMLKFAKDKENDECYMEERECIVAALEYILDKTPKSDVFELDTINKEDISAFDDTAVLYRNNKPVAEGEIDAGCNGAIFGCINALSNFVRSEKYERTTPTQEQLCRVKKEKEDLHKNYFEKKRELTAKYEKEFEKLRQHYNTQIAPLNKREADLCAREEKEAIKDLNDISRRI